MSETLTIDNLELEVWPTVILHSEHMVIDIAVVSRNSDTGEVKNHFQSGVAQIDFSELAGLLVPHLLPYLPESLVGDLEQRVAYAHTRVQQAAQHERDVAIASLEASSAYQLVKSMADTVEESEAATE